MVKSGIAAPLNDAILIAVAQLVDDSQTDRRDPSHSDIEFQIRKYGLTPADPISQGQTVGKTKRVRAVLNWCLENDQEEGGRFIVGLIGVIRGHGGFRPNSQNFVGSCAVENCAAAFDAEGFVLGADGDLQPKVLDALSGAALTDALMAYVRRAKRGVEDAALLTGTSKDLVEAVAAHVIQTRFGFYSNQSNFPTLLGQAFSALGLSTPQTPVQTGEPPQCRIERALYELACGVNQLRNRQGTGHGRPWLPTVSAADAKGAAESMGLVAEYLLLRL